ncbi:MAG: response regulator transcription factor [Actinomycetota bacterium]|nr:response regulator transcription factor [Actinomycetota bacterium]
MPGGRPRLLIVEDHELLAGTLALALRLQGLEVQAVAGPSVEAVVDLARELVPVLVLLDLDLGEPLGDGVEMVAPLTAAGARVLVVSGVTDRARLGACIEAGAVGIVGKHSGFERLVEAVLQSADGRPVLPDEDRQALLADVRERRRADQERLALFGALSPRELAVLGRLVAGDSAESIAERLFVSVATVRSHIRAILLKLGVNSQLAAVAVAHDAGWRPTAD